VEFRVLQGMSGGLLAPMAQMMIARAAGKHMARVMGYAAYWYLTWCREGGSNPHDPKIGGF
jgi:MFS family permease